MCVECSKQTQHSEIKNHAVGVEHRGVCVECLKETQNSETDCGVGVEHRGVCVECSKLLNFKFNVRTLEFQFVFVNRL